MDDPNEFERATIQTFTLCDARHIMPDVIYVFPSDRIAEPERRAATLQSAVEFLQAVTDMDLKRCFGRRVCVGYADELSQDCWCGSSNAVCLIPDRLDGEDQPMAACSHELVHPAYYRSPLHGSNEPWGDGFCDFIRGPLLQVMGQDGVAYWRKKIADVRNRTGGQGGYIAGQFATRLLKVNGLGPESDDQAIAGLITKVEAIKRFVGWLFAAFADQPLYREFRPTRRIVSWLRDRGLDIVPEIERIGLWDGNP